jgi:hypothetical protein
METLSSLRALTMARGPWELAAVISLGVLFFEVRARLELVLADIIHYPSL